MREYINCFRKFGVFRGRATRREFWSFSLISAAAIMILLLIHAGNEVGALHDVISYIIVIYIAATLIPFLSVMSRRWHDLDRTGKWVLLILIPGVGLIVSLCFFLCRGSHGTNRFGRDPREYIR